DVSEARERMRLRRLRRLAVLLWAITIPFLVRIGIGVDEVLHGRPATTWGLPFPHLPTGWTALVPSMLLVGGLLAVVLVPFLAAGRSPHVLYRPEDIDMTLDDVVGAGPVVEEVVKTLNLFLAYCTFRDAMGGTPRRAVLFEGPPGTGKTYLAKAMAAEAGVPFLFVSSSAFQSMYYGQTNRKIRAYFKALRSYARREGGAIGFIEEIDAIGAARSGMGGSGREGVTGVVNELLIQLQSFDQPTVGQRMRSALTDAANGWLPAGHRLRRPTREPANVLVIGATNRAGDLDPALVRPGRFDRTITVDLPNRAGRREILDYYLARKAHEPALDDPARRDALAAMTFGYSPVSLERLLDEALVWALRRGSDRLGWEDVQRAKMTTELGVAQPASLVERERLTVATHEAGHATVAWLLAPERSLEVLSIIKRRNALGLLAHSDAEERWMTTRSDAEHLLRIAFGGMAAEEAFFGETGSGVAGDLEAATGLAARMVGSWGMAGSLASYEAIQTPTAGNVTARVLGDESGRGAVEELLGEARRDTVALVTANRDLVAALRDALLERDELIGQEIADVLVAAEGVRRTVDLRDPSLVTTPPPAP
ncbi:MAG TPA: AAA family ATPase, partial [Acidimicrobiales bacterium]|nr:AAA family ATPase [Acidimicrobiales bacterium]